VEDLRQGPPLIFGDSKLLYQAFSNLLSNALKYSPSGSPVQVTAAGDAGALVVSVQDRGIGIPAGELEHLFERYHRGSNVKGIVGTGVGLYLVRMVVELHGGTITAENLGVGGARFTVRLPADARGVQQAEMPAAVAQY
jgi:signal transduction histidine kinase